MKKRKESQHKKVEAFLKVIRDSFHDSMIVYRYGGCYGLYQILKLVFPTARAYFEDENRDHILIKIGGVFYDIEGEDTGSSKHTALTRRDHELCRKWAHGQRLEYMIAKYQRRINEVGKLS